VSRIVGAFTAQACNILQAAECIEYFLNEMEIVFYSHRVSYPSLLSAQVLPFELKELAINNLETVRTKISQFKNVQKHPILTTITDQQIQDNINYLRAKDQHYLWNDFLEFNSRLDKSRNQKLLDVIPEFKPYV
jgi:hypothetical protein